MTVPFKPKLVTDNGATIENATEESRLKAELLRKVEQLRVDVEAGTVVGLIGVVVHESGNQTEMVVSNETLFSIVGRLHTGLNSLTLMGD